MTTALSKSANQRLISKNQLENLRGFRIGLRFFLKMLTKWPVYWTETDSYSVCNRSYAGLLPLGYGTFIPVRAGECQVLIIYKENYNFFYEKWELFWVDPGWKSIQDRNFLALIVCLWYSQIIWTPSDACLNSCNTNLDLAIRF